MYQHELFTQKEPRTVHMGVDIGAPAGTRVHSFFRGQILEQKVHTAPGDYGPTLITSHELSSQHTLYALWGHLSQQSLGLRKAGDLFEAGEVLGWMGTSSENGGWNPHLHFQLSWLWITPPSPVISFTPSKGRALSTSGVVRFLVDCWREAGRRGFGLDGNLQ